MAGMRPNVLYLSHAPNDVYALVREATGGEFNIVTLVADDDRERIEKIADCEVVICSAYPLRANVLAAAARLRLVHHQGVGWQDTIDWEELRRRNIPLVFTPEGTTIGVAEHTILLMLAACKHLSFADAELRHGRWHINALRPISREIYGKTIGYIGMGRIACAVAERLKVFGCSGLYHDPDAVLTTERKTALGVTAAPFNEILARSDIITIHVPLTPRTRGLLGADTLARMKDGAILINTSRGHIIDEAALAAALRSGKLLAAGLDVFSQEPPPLDHPLLALPNVVLTPHIAAGTKDAFQAKMAAIFANIRRFYRGEKLRNRVEGW